MDRPSSESRDLARAESPRGELVLREHRPDDGGPTRLELRANGVFVMDNVEVGTEQALARSALARVERPEAVLIGGLGLGFTMHEVLGDSRVARCTVVEIEQALVDWMRDGTVGHGPGLLADERLDMVVADVAHAVAEASPGSYDLVLMDVDNGPGYLVHEANAALYDVPFLQRVHEVLREDGVLAVWSAAEAPALGAALAGVFAEVVVDEHDVRLQDRDERYYLYLGLRTAG